MIREGWCSIGSTGADIHAVLDDDGGRRLIDLTVLPGHVLTGQTAEAHAVELLAHRIADVGSGCAGVKTGRGECLVDCIDTVIGVGCELVRGLNIRRLLCSVKSIRRRVLGI